ncbi:MAG: flippase-like domain-containing protein [Flavobacteriales bacterium]|nr:flippase-like domain-containing protein [Flavobacteriales bacterium]
MKAVKWIKYVFFLFLGIGLMYLAFKNQSPKALIAQLKDVNYLWVVISMFFGFISIVSRSLRWIILLQNLNFSVSKLNSFYAVAIGYFTNIAIPRAGEITRCTSLNQTEDVPVDKLFGTIILERAIDFIILISLVFLVLILKFELFLEFLAIIFEGQTLDVNSLIGIGLSAMAILFLLFVLTKKILKKSAVYIKIKTFVVGMKDGFKSINGLENKTGFWAHTFIIWLMYLLMTYVCFFSIEATRMLNVADGLYTMVIGGFGMVAPVQGGIGAYHYIVKVGLMILDVSEDSALLFATVVHTAQTLMTLSVGGISILMVFLSKRKAKQ